MQCSSAYPSDCKHPVRFRLVRMSWQQSRYVQRMLWSQADVVGTTFQEIGSRKMRSCGKPNAIRHPINQPWLGVMITIIPLLEVYPISWTSNLRILRMVLMALALPSKLGNDIFTMKPVKSAKSSRSASPHRPHTAHHRHLQIPV